jgi:signal transduction histidine kinase
MRFKTEALTLSIYVFLGAIFFYTLLSFDRHEFSESQDKWISIVSGVAPQLIEEGNLLKLQSLLRSQGRFPVAIADMEKNVLVSNLNGTMDLEKFESKLLIMSSQPVGYLFFDSRNGVGFFDRKYWVYFFLWAAVLIGALLVLNRQKDLYFVSKLCEDLSLGQVSRPRGYPRKYIPLLEAAMNYGSVVTKNAEMRMEVEHNREMMNVVLKVAHDIRSPLSALSILTSKSVQIDAEQRDLIKSVIGRTSEIADSILMEYREKEKAIRKTLAVHTGDLKPENIYALLRLMVKEKAAQYESHPVLIRFDIEDEKVKLDSSLVARGAFNRLLSNIINNAIEASCNKGEVKIGLSYSNDDLSIFIKDHGCGMDEEQIKALGRKQRSTDKDFGHGFGLLQAIDLIESWGGKMKISSTIKIGTEVQILLPKYKAE